MNSKSYTEAFVWMWPPGRTNPVPIGQLNAIGSNTFFSYLISYYEGYETEDPPVPIFVPELPLELGQIPLIDGLSIPSCIRDASPDAWGRRVILNGRFGKEGNKSEPNYINEITYLLNSGSDRIGALDFQLSPSEYIPRNLTNASLEELLESADRLEKGESLGEEQYSALLHGTSIGGARPKALIDDNGRKYIAKFSKSSDHLNFIKMEYVAMKLAEKVGLDVAPVNLVKVNRRDVLLVQRFDRVKYKKRWKRRHMVSGLTLLELDEMMARYASYQSLAAIILFRFASPKKTLKELFSRLVFNILCGNTDDHARNHSAFWDGETLALTPAYDICPQSRTGNISSQAMNIVGRNNFSQLKNCVATAPHFLLSMSQAKEIIEMLISSIYQNWDEVCEAANLTNKERTALWGRQFLNPFAFEV